MVLSRRGGENPALLSASENEVLYFDGKEEIQQFLFVFENVLAHDKEPEEKCRHLFYYLRGAAFKEYVKRFSENGKKTTDADNYDAVRAWLLSRYRRVESASQVTAAAVNGKLDPSKLLESMHRLTELYASAKFNEEACFGLMHQACMEVRGLATYTAVKTPTTFDSLKETIRSYEQNRDALSRDSLNVLGLSVAAASQPMPTVLRNPKRKPDPNDVRAGEEAGSLGRQD